MLMVVKPRMPVTTELLPRGRERKEEDEEEGAIDGVDCLPPLSPGGRPVSFCCRVPCGWVWVVGEGLGEWWQG